jgi:mono/diheme cytochrome c family protein
VAQHRSARSRQSVALVVVIAVVSALGACSADETASTTSSTTLVDPDTPPDGASLYVASCGECHGDDLRGTVKGPSHLSIVYEPNHHSDDSFRSAIANGVPAHHWDFGDMPPVPGLTTAEVDAIIAYVREQQELHGFEE